MARTVFHHSQVPALLVAIFPLMVVAVGIGVVLGLGRVHGIGAGARLTIWLLLMVPLTLWLVAVTVLDRVGVYRRFRPAALIGVAVPVVLGVALFAALPHGDSLTIAVPLWWPIAFMVVRLLGGVFLIVWCSGEVASPWFVVWAGGLDLFVGATAVPVAALVAGGAAGAVPVAVAWNVIGIVDFAGAIVIARLVPAAAPGNLLSSTGPVSTAWRPVMTGILTFGVPLALLMHLVSFHQLLSRC